MHNFFSAVLDLLFGCRHGNYSFPITVRRQGRPQPTYTVCLDCGREFAYDWQQMKRLDALQPRRRARQQAVRMKIRNVER